MSEKRFTEVSFANDVNQQNDYEMQGSEILCAESGFNLNSKMIEMQGYQFNHNKNHQAMQKNIYQGSHQQSRDINEICTSPIGKKQNVDRMEFTGFSQYANNQNMQLGDAQSLFNRKCWPWAYVVVILVQESKFPSRLLWFLKLSYPLHQDIWWNLAIWAHQIAGDESWISPLNREIVHVGTRSFFPEIWL